MSTLRVSAINNAAAGSGGLEISATGNVTGAGLDLITAQSFTAASTVSVNNCFTSTYENYRVSISSTASTTSILQARLRLSGADETANWTWNRLRWQGAVVDGGSSTNAFMRWDVNNSTSDLGWYAYDLYAPALAVTTLYTGLSANSAGWGMNSGKHANATAYDGLTIYPSTGTITGTIRVYGYRD